MKSYARRSRAPGPFARWNNGYLAVLRNNRGADGVRESYYACHMRRFYVMVHGGIEPVVLRPKPSKPPGSVVTLDQGGLRSA